MKPGCLFLNTARGPVVVTDALLDALRRGTVAHTVVDTWEGEPAFRRDLLAGADLGTPHIAGYSFEGKVAGTAMVYREACRFLGVKPSWSPEGRMPGPDVPFVDVEAGDRADEAVLWDAVRRVYDIEADDRDLREGDVEDAAERGRRFDRLRKEYPVRREFRFAEARLRNAGPGLRERFAGLGFAVK
jgi:erythronate-4-phosphate dehydrogenase